jgi:hypothetical protein
MNIKSVGFLFYITPVVEFSGKPEAKNILNSFDFIGDFVSTSRLEGETVVSFKQRLMDVSVHPGGPTYLGVVNNLTRDFGYLRQKALTIDLVLDEAGDPEARNPRVDILSNRVVLYSDWRPDGTAVVDTEVSIYKPTDSGYFLSDLINEINGSSCFTATIDPNARPNYHSSNLVRDTSDIVISTDPIKSDKRTILSAQHIVEDSLVFSEPNVFITLVASPPAVAGEYSIDRVNGIIETYTIPSGNYATTYHAGNFPMEIDYSPIKVYTLNDDDFQSELFIRETLSSEEEVSGLPNTEGSEIMHQLFKETEVFWGK